VTLPPTSPFDAENNALSPNSSDSNENARQNYPLSPQSDMENPSPALFDEFGTNNGNNMNNYDSLPNSLSQLNSPSLLTQTSQSAAASANNQQTGGVNVAGLATVHPTQGLYPSSYHYSCHLQSIQAQLTSTTLNLQAISPGVQVQQLQIVPAKLQQQLATLSLQPPQTALNKHPSHNPVHEYSPVFLQLIETIYQLVHQHPTQFEFNSSFLYDLYTAALSGRHSIFEYNTDSERSQAWNSLYRHLFFSQQLDKVNEKEGSNLLDAFFWSNFLHPSILQRFLNPLYDPSHINTQSNIHVLNSNAKQSNYFPMSTHNNQNNTPLQSTTTITGGNVGNTNHRSPPLSLQQQQQGKFSKKSTLVAKSTLPELVIFKELYLITPSTYIYHPNQSLYYQPQSHPHFALQQQFLQGQNSQNNQNNHQTATNPTTMTPPPKQQTATPIVTSLARTGSMTPQQQQNYIHNHIPTPPVQHDINHTFQQTLMPTTQTIFPLSAAVSSELRTFLRGNPELDLLTIQERQSGWFGGLFGR
jgi:hypothetical protein